MKRVLVACVVILAVFLGLTIVPVSANADMPSPPYREHPSQPETEPDGGQGQGQGQGAPGCSNAIVEGSANSVAAGPLAIGVGAVCVSIGATVLIVWLARKPS